jgi:exosortase
VKKRADVKGREFLLPLIGLVAAWVILITQTRHHWGGESYYNFGWFVPFMAVWLLLVNFSDLEPVSRERIRGHLILSGLCILFVIPFHALSEVNPFWRLPLWVQATGLSAFSLLVIHSMYGMKGVVKALFPLFFLTTMIPWPYRMEVEIVQSLTGVVVSFAMDGLHFLGYPVELAGNSFVLGELNIGVNEACSGIRSLQALFMVTLFLGSLFGQGWKRRLAAVMILPLVVVVVNTGRAIFLAIQVIENGQAAYEKWHDPAGYIAFGVSMILIYACIELFNFGARGRADTRTLNLEESWQKLGNVRMKGSAMGFALLPLILFLSVEGWFRFHEARAGQGSEWDLVVPSENDPTVEFAEISKEAEGLLGYDYGYRFIKTFSHRVQGEVYFYGYNPENRLSSVSSYGHSPTICMQSSGAFLVEEFSGIVFNMSNGPGIELKHYLFELPGSGLRMHIFWTVWERRNMDIPLEDLQAFNYRTQWVQLWKGRRDFSRKVLLVSLMGARSDSEARRTLNDLLKESLVVKPG